MKKIIFIGAIVLSFACLFTFSSCKKTAETFQILGAWTVSSYGFNGADQTTAFKALYQNYRIDFDASKNYQETYVQGGVNIDNAGAYVLINSGNDLQLTNSSDHSVRTLHIIKFTSNTADLTESNGTKEYNWTKQ